MAHNKAKNSCTIQIALTDEQRRALLRAYPAKHSNVLCRHITLEYGVPESTVVDGKSVQIGIYGRAWDGRTDALLVTVAGLDTRKDGNLFHITLSLADGVSPGEAKSVVGKETTVFQHYDLSVVGRPALVRKHQAQIERRHAA